MAGARPGEALWNPGDRRCRCAAADQRECRAPGVEGKFRAWGQPPLARSGTGRRTSGKEPDEPGAGRRSDDAYQHGPVAALRRVAFLMERGREETRRVQAFRNAAATILPLPDDEVAERVEAGTLTELAGIGPSTAAVIEAAVRGE